MKKVKFSKGMVLALGLAMVSGVALAAGLYTNGMPLVGAPTQNGVALSAPNGVVSQVAPVAGNLLPMDTNLTGGAAPQTVGVTPFQLAATMADFSQNTATSTAAAATLNTKGGLITTESLSTAAGATYSFVLTNSLITATGNPIQVAMYSKTNTGGAVSVTSVTNAAGSATIVFTNTGATAFNGTMMIVFHI